VFVVSLVIKTIWNWPGLAFSDTLHIFTVVTWTKRLLPRINENDVLKSNVLHGDVFGAKEDTRTLFGIIHCDIAEHDVLVGRISRSFTPGEWNFRPANGTRMRCTEVNRIALLSRANPDRDLTGVVDDNVLISYILDSSALLRTPPEFHVNALSGVMHIGISESDVLNSVVAAD